MKELKMENELRKKKLEMSGKIVKNAKPLTIF